VLKINRVRADTTVVEANVAYPTDSGLLAKGVARMAKIVKRLKKQGLATGTFTRDRTRTVSSRARDMSANLKKRSEEAKDAVRAINTELAGIAEQAIKEAQAVVRNASRELTKTGSARSKAWVKELSELADRVATVVDQTRQRMSGIMPDGANRLVSLHDPDARPIRKGRLGKPVEFGYKAQMVDNEDGVVLDHNVEIGNPPDAPMLVPAIERIKQRAGRAPGAVTADRGYSEKGVEQDLKDLGVANVVLPARGKPSAERKAFQNRGSFQRMVRWRTGCEGRISCLKRDFGWDRTLIDGIDGARIWCGHGVFNHNLVKIAGLVD
jgi:IS5 family transposase